MAKLRFQFNKFDKFDFKIIVNNGDVSKRKNCDNISQSGIYNIRLPYA